MSRLGRRQRFGLFYLGNVFDSSEIRGAISMVAGAVLGLNGTVVAPTTVTGALAMVGGAVLTMAGGLIFSSSPLGMTGNATLNLAGAQIHAGTLAMVGGALLTLHGSGGSPGSIDPNTVRGGVVAVGIRGGHSSPDARWT